MSRWFRFSFSKTHTKGSLVNRIFCFLVLLMFSSVTYAESSDDRATVGFLTLSLVFYTLFLFVYMCREINKSFNWNTEVIQALLFFGSIIILFLLMIAGIISYIPFLLSLLTAFVLVCYVEYNKLQQEYKLINEILFILMMISVVSFYGIVILKIVT